MREPFLAEAGGADADERMPRKAVEGDVPVVVAVVAERDEPGRARGGRAERRRVMALVDDPAERDQADQCQRDGGGEHGAAGQADGAGPQQPLALAARDRGCG